MNWKHLLLGLSIAAVGAVTAAHASISIVEIASPGNWSAFDNVRWACSPALR